MIFMAFAFIKKGFNAAMLQAIGSLEPRVASGGAVLSVENEAKNLLSDILEKLPEGDFVLPKHRAAVDGVPDPGAVGPMAREEPTAGGGAGGSHVIVVEGDGLGVQGVQVRSFDPGVTVAAEIAVALVVGDDEDDVGFPGSRTRAPEPGTEEESEDEGAHGGGNSGKEGRFCNSHLPGG